VGYNNGGGYVNHDRIYRYCSREIAATITICLSPKTILVEVAMDRSMAEEVQRCTVGLQVHTIQVSITVTRAIVVEIKVISNKVLHLKGMAVGQLGAVIPISTKT
jgi:hypothetical protein